MGRTDQPKLQSSPEAFERNLILAAIALLAIGLWIGGAFEVAPYLTAAKGTRDAFIGKLLVWNHDALTKVVLNPFLARPILFLLGAAALSLAPLAYGMSKGLWRHTHDAAIWATCFALALGLAFLGPELVLPASLAPFAAAWWKATTLLGASAGLFLVGFIRVSGRTMSARDILRQPHAYDLMDLSGAATLHELKHIGLLLRAPEWPPPNIRDLKGRLCIGRLYDEGRPTGYFVAPEIAKLQQTLVVAPTGSGKTTLLALPWSRELPGKGQSVFVLDFKGDMAKDIRLGFSAWEAQKLWVFNPMSMGSVHWNPMREPVSGTADFVESQEAIAEAIYGEVNGGAYQYFDLLDLRILKAGVRAVGHLEAPCLKALHDLFLSEQHVRGNPGSHQGPGGSGRVRPHPG